MNKKTGRGKNPLFFLSACSRRFAAECSRERKPSAAKKYSNQIFQPNIPARQNIPGGGVLGWNIFAGADIPPPQKKRKKNLFVALKVKIVVFTAKTEETFQPNIPTKYSGKAKYSNLRQKYSNRNSINLT